MTGNFEKPVVLESSMTSLTGSVASTHGHLHAGRHDLAGGARPEGDRALHQVGGLGVEGALARRASGQRGELVGGPRRAELLLRLDAERAHDARWPSR